MLNLSRQEIADIADIKPVAAAFMAA